MVPERRNYFNTSTDQENEREKDALVRDQGLMAFIKKAKDLQKDEDDSHNAAQDEASDRDRKLLNKLKQQELRGEYALIYALLVSIRRAGLIQKFQKYEIKLEGTRYLCDADFDNLRRYETGITTRGWYALI